MGNVSNKISIMSRWFFFLVAVCLNLNLFAVQNPSFSNIANFSKIPDVYSVKISPDGSMIGILRKIEDERIVSIIDLETSSHIETHRFIKKGQIGDFEWLSNKRLIFTRVTTFSGENRLYPSGDIYAVDIDGKKGIMLTGRNAKRSSDTSKDDPKKRATIENMLEEDPEHILVKFYSSDLFFKLYRVNVYDGKMERIASPPIRQPEYIYDTSGNLIAAGGINLNYEVQIYIFNKNVPKELLSSKRFFQIDPSIERVIVSSPGKTKKKNPNWTLWRTTKWDETLLPISFDKEKGVLVTKEHGGQDLVGIYQTNFKDGKKKLIYRNKTVDIGSTYIDENDNLYAVGLNNGYPSYVFLAGNSKYKQHRKKLINKFPGQRISIESYSDDNKKLTLFTSSDVNPGSFFLYDVVKDEIRPLAKYWSSIDYNNLSMMDPFSFEARDGSTIYGFYTPSRTSKPEDSPTILFPHGGPEARDYWGFDEKVQLLSSEGYNVVQINFRGSSGYGLKYQRFIYGNWDGVLNDLFDGVEYLSKISAIDINKICINGASYGGYAAAQGAIMRPDLFKCAISNVGVFDLPGLYEKGDMQQSRGGKVMLDLRLGTDKEKQKRMSPFYNVEKLSVPFFLIHGENDIRAPFEDAVRFSDLLNKKGIKHEKLFIEKEGHGYANEEVREQVNSRVISFFDKHLK